MRIFSLIFRALESAGRCAGSQIGSVIRPFAGVAGQESRSRPEIPWRQRLSVSMISSFLREKGLSFKEYVCDLLAPGRDGTSASRNGTAPVSFRDGIQTLRSRFVYVALFSLAVNILMLAGPLFMLQIYDRVLVSQSVPTLVVLFFLVVVLYIFLNVFDLYRARILSREGYRLDRELAPVARRIWLRKNLDGEKQARNPVEDLRTVRQFLDSPSVTAIFDLPFAPFFLLVVYILHVQLGLLATAGAVAVFALTIMTEFLTRKSSLHARKYSFYNSHVAGNFARNSEVIVAMGMMDQVNTRWDPAHSGLLHYSQKSSQTAQSVKSITKTIRMIIQSAILGLGAFLAIRQEISFGTIIAASILAGRALAPVDQVMGGWRHIIGARQSYRALNEDLSGFSGKRKFVLPEPEGKLSVKSLYKYAKEKDSALPKPILNGLDFELEPGDALGVIGPSASGKTSLARLLVGVRLPDRGSVRLDGATFQQWDPDVLGRYIGYLPQEVGMISGSIRDNIARFSPDATDEMVVEAARVAGVHEMIVKFPEGYETQLSSGQNYLSGGQIQRIGLARALFNSPPLVVLDEPNSNLDAEGENSLVEAIKSMRAKGSCIVVMAHRPSVIASVNRVLMLRDGNQADYGPRDEVLARVTRSKTPVKAS